MDMDRRDFLKMTAAGVAALAIPGTSSATSLQPEPPETPGNWAQMAGRGPVVLECPPELRLWSQAYPSVGVNLLRCSTPGHSYVDEDVVDAFRAAAEGRPLLLLAAKGERIPEVLEGRGLIDVALAYTCRKAYALSPRFVGTSWTPIRFEADFRFDNPEHTILWVRKTGEW